MEKMLSGAEEDSPTGSQAYARRLGKALEVLDLFLPLRGELIHVCVLFPRGCLLLMTAPRPGLLVVRLLGASGGSQGWGSSTTNRTYLGVNNAMPTMARRRPCGRGCRRAGSKHDLWCSRPDGSPLEATRKAVRICRELTTRKRRDRDSWSPRVSQPAPTFHAG